MMVMKCFHCSAINPDCIKIITYYSVLILYINILGCIFLWNWGWRFCAAAAIFVYMSRQLELSLISSVLQKLWCRISASFCSSNGFCLQSFPPRTLNMWSLSLSLALVRSCVFSVESNEAGLCWGGREEEEEEEEESVTHQWQGQTSTARVKVKGKQDNEERGEWSDNRRDVKPEGEDRWSNTRGFRKEGEVFKVKDEVMCSQVHPQQNWERLFIDQIMTQWRSSVWGGDIKNRSLHYYHVVFVPVQCDFCSHRIIFICYNS